MRLLKGLFFLIVFLVAVFAGVGWFLPDRVEVERDIVIDRPPAEVFALLDGFGRFNEWSPWRDYDATATYEYAGPARGVGAIMRWRGDAGEGSQEIVAMEPPNSITVKLDFGTDGVATSHYLLRPAGAGTRLVWRFEFDAEGHLVSRWFNLLLDRMIGPDYERGLADLKVLAESQPAEVAPPPAEEAPQEPMEGEAAEAGEEAAAGDGAEEAPAEASTEGDAG
ncbi:SRPBCC family protein [Pseudomarimonas salicorniae]|uniref:SRPBCC family protein n=1 Tax=Pseudomarimonas salicorniae TaxID=2933270 RepID=A0ABT0GCY5_9GAMM|nr:SRPBCC family protein [Lysobacter sp. CAU 1642]MCK7592399.1 SRPBCC family protein [Lysobacter sp. CAU 1642]